MAAIRLTPPPIQYLCEELHGRQPICITINKRITQSDLNKQQSGLRLPKSSQTAFQENLLSLNQQAAANFLSISEMESMIEINFLTEGDARRARALEGVTVQVFVFCPGEPRRQGEGKLKRWNCGAIVIHGMSAVQAWSHLNEGDLVEMWGFKDEENRLYVAIYPQALILQVKRQAWEVIPAWLPIEIEEIPLRIWDPEDTQMVLYQSPTKDAASAETSAMD